LRRDRPTVTVTVLVNQAVFSSQTFSSRASALRNPGLDRGVSAYMRDNAPPPPKDYHGKMADKPTPLTDLRKRMENEKAP
jgi:hypothetical protein